MSESNVLNAQCEQCNHMWDPFGNQKFTVPHYATLTCPECKHEQKMRWLDSETSKLYAKKELGLNENDRVLNQKIRDLEHFLNVLRNTTDLKLPLARHDRVVNANQLGQRGTRQILNIFEIKQQVRAFVFLHVPDNLIAEIGDRHPVQHAGVVDCTHGDGSLDVEFE